VKEMVCGIVVRRRSILFIVYGGVWFAGGERWLDKG
jgi:hypothetical protein